MEVFLTKIKYNLVYVVADIESRITLMIMKICFWECY